MKKQVRYLYALENRAQASNVEESLLDIFTPTRYVAGARELASVFYWHKYSMCVAWSAVGMSVLSSVLQAPLFVALGVLIALLSLVHIVYTELKFTQLKKEFDDVGVF